MGLGLAGRLGAAFSLALAAIAPAHAGGSTNFDSAFDKALGTEVRAPQSFEAIYSDPFERRVAALADGSQGRIGVAAVDLATGQQIAVLGDQRFPMASTSKIAIAATFMEGVEQGRWSLSSEFALKVPVRSQPFSSAKAPVTNGQYFPAVDLIEMMITRSNNQATDALLAAVGGPSAVNAWAHRNGIADYNLTRDIATLVRDDGEIDPAQRIDFRDSATPEAMVKLLTGLYQGQFLSASSRQVILGAMGRCKTGVRRMKADLPEGATVAHKTGSLSNTSSDIGIIHTADGRNIAVAIYVTGQGSRLAREGKIASIARAIYDGYTAQPAAGRNWVSAQYPSQ